MTEDERGSIASRFEAKVEFKKTVFRVSNSSVLGLNMPKKINLTLVNQSPENQEIDVAQITRMVGKCSTLLEAWLKKLETKSTLEESEAALKKALLGERSSLLDAVVDLGTLTLKIEDYTARKNLENMLASEAVTEADSDIIARYLASLNPHEE